MNPEEITATAESIIAQGNGYAVPARALLALPESSRRLVWKEILRIGAAQDDSAELFYP